MKGREKIIGYTVSVYPTLRSDSEPILPKVLNYKIIANSKVSEFINKYIAVDPNCNSVVIHQENPDYVITVASYGIIRWDKLVTPEDSLSLTKLSYYKGYIYMHINISAICMDVTEAEEYEEKVIAAMGSYEKDRLLYNTEWEHFAHNDNDAFADVLSRDMLTRVDRFDQLEDGTFAHPKTSVRLTLDHTYKDHLQP